MEIETLVQEVRDGFEEWRNAREPELRRETFVDAWAKVAYLAEAREREMGQALGKLQARIGRQRAANRRQHQALREARAVIAVQQETLERLEKKE